MRQLALPLEQPSEPEPIKPAVTASFVNFLAGSLAESSIKQYQWDIGAYAAFAHEHNLSELDALTLETWRDYLIQDYRTAEGTLLSPNSINRMLSAVKRVIQEAARRRLIDMPAWHYFELVPPVSVRDLRDRLKKNAHVRITPDDMRRLCDAPDRTDLLGLRDAALLATLASSGIRREEVATLTQGQIAKEENGYVLLITGKSEVTAVKVPLSDEAYDLIREWIARRPIESRYIFTSMKTRGRIPSAEHLCNDAVYKIVKRYTEACGLGDAKTHDMRRFVGTQLTKKYDVKKAASVLRHKNIRITYEHYVLDDGEVAGLTNNLY